MTDPPEFQAEAIKRIVERLSDKSGTRRFLLADEVGLGKTIVAKGVVERLRKRRGFNLVYVCSNTEIADQNRGKLSDEQVKTPSRLTLLALSSNQIRRSHAAGKLQVFAFTPGTSLQLDSGTGIALERRLLLYLLFRVWRKPVGRKNWREFFQCNAGDRWDNEASVPRLRSEFAGQVARDYRMKVKAQWSRLKVTLERGSDAKLHSVSDVIDDCVETYVRNPEAPAEKRNRNRVIGELRKGLARVSLEFLDPHLIILDEFQNFSDIMVATKNENSIVARLLSIKSPILILSATPYKMYTLSYEAKSHHDGFIETLGFLWNEPANGRNVSEIRKELEVYRQHLESGRWVNGHDEALYKLRDRIENRLRQVMSRTERNWYLDDIAKGVSEHGEEGNAPGETELTDYIHLRRFLLGHQLGDWNITDFWKSCPSPLLFMDGQYWLTGRLRRQRTKLPAEVWQRDNAIDDLARRSVKFRLLFDKVFGPEPHRPTWRYLWVKPTYTYYRDTFYGQDTVHGPGGPSKYLVFSHWRFVPKAVSILTSLEAADKVGRPRKRQQSSPLQFREKLGWYPLDICYPSPLLATCVNQIELRGSNAGGAESKEVFAAARLILARLLKDNGIGIGDVRKVPMWRIVARLESRSEFSGEVKKVLRAASTSSNDDTSAYLPDHIEQYLAWMDDGSELTISPVWLDRLTKVALHSPALAVQRAFWSMFPDEAPAQWVKLLLFTLGPLRHYFNKRLVQTIINKNAGGASYTERILAYCEKAHFQAVIDEYAYLVRHVLQVKTPGDFLDHIGRAMGMWSGLPGTNVLTHSGHLAEKATPRPAHFALAFGDRVSGEQKETKGKARGAESSGKGRKSSVREAFNSPFWPFVLATTSVGQEGLDFHLYCRDIIHWNLPSNPVDFEQREGRINRYDGMSIRRSIGEDFPLCTLSLDKKQPLWTSIFQAVTDSGRGGGHFKHGLFPHWIYQSHGANGQESEQRPIVRRHLLFYAGSSDQQHYTDLKRQLALYRLVFGQPRQQDILDRIAGAAGTQDVRTLTSRLTRYMINLSPIPPSQALHRAQRLAGRFAADPVRLDRLVSQAEAHLSRLPAVEGFPTELSAELTSKVQDLLRFAVTDSRLGDVSLLKVALAAIIYLLDPYDAVHDGHGAIGLEDDLEVVREAHQRVCVHNTINGSTGSIASRLTQQD